MTYRPDYRMADSDSGPDAENYLARTIHEHAGDREFSGLLNARGEKLYRIKRIGFFHFGEGQK